MKVIGNLTKDAIIRAVASEALTVTQAVGTEVIMNAGSTTGFAAAFDSNAGKVVIAYSDGADGNKGKAVVGTVDPSNNSISLGSEVVFQNSEITGDQMDCVFDSNANKVVIFYTDTNNPYTNDRTGTAIVGTVSGTSISFGTKAAFESGNTQFINACFDSSNNKFVVAYKDADNSDRGTSAVGTVSGTDISFGSPVVFNNANTNNIAIEFDSSNNKVVIAYRDVGASQQVTAIVGTVSGTSISYGSEVVVSASSATQCDLIFDSSNNKMVVVYQDSGDADKGKAHVGTVSGTSISFGSAVTFNAGASEYHRGVFDTEAGKIAIVYKDGGNSNRPTFVSGTVSGTDITFDTETVLKDVEGVTIFPGVAYDSTNKRVVAAYLDTTGSDNGLAQVIKVGYSAATGGTIADGAPVIINANGTVSSVGLTSISQNVGSGEVFESAQTHYINSVFDSSTNRVVIIYKDDGNNNYGTAVVGSVSGNSISFGTPVPYHNGQVVWSKAVFDSTNNKVVIAYRKDDGGGDGGAIVGTVDPSDNSISFGSETEFETGEVSSSSWPLSAVFDSSQGKVVIVYRESSNSSRGMAIVGTVSGTSISFGSNVTFESSNTTNIEAAFDSNSNKVVIFYNASSTGKAIVGTVSGTSISFGSSVNITGNDLREIHGTFDSTNNKIIVAYKDPDGTVAGQGGAVVGTVSGTSITFGSETLFRSKNCNHVSIAFDSNINKIIVTYQNDTDTPKVGELVVGTVSGTSISFDTQVVFDSSISAGHSSYSSAIFDSNSDKVVISFADSSNARYGTSLVLQAGGSVPNLTTENFIGFMKGAALDGTNGEILSSCNVARNLTSLTPGQTYFVTGTGALSETAGSPSVTAGTAISSTELIVKG